MMRTVFALALAGIALAGCSDSMINSFTFMQTREKPIARDVFPAGFKQEILQAVPSAVADPNGIRDAYYSDPVIDPKINTYVSCVRFNARDSSGQYVGSKEYAVYYYGGHLNQFVTAPPDQCLAARYQPFPEVEKLCPGGKCK